MGHARRRSKGKSRIEAFQELDIQKAELLDTGEIRLPSGKIIGHRQYKNIYRQRPRLPDQREQVIINKLAIEYRKLSKGDTANLKGGQLMVADQGKDAGAKSHDIAREKTLKRKQKDHMQIGIKQNKLMFHFRVASNV